MSGFFYVTNLTAIINLGGEMFSPDESSSKPPKEIDGKWVLLLFVVLLTLVGFLAKYGM